MEPAGGALIATHSGLRGRPGAELRPEVVTATVTAFAALLRAAGLPATVGLARDERPSGEGLARTVAAAATAAGLDVVDFGVVATPTAKLAARRRALGGLVAVTGSHLGPDWNGIKLVTGPDYLPVDVRRLPEPDGAVAARGRVVADDAAAAEHADAVLAGVDGDALRAASLAVSLEGGAGRAADLALEALGCTVAADAPVGLRLDADGDRLQLADAGEPVDTEATLALAVLARGATRIVKGADTGRMVDVLAAERGGWVDVVPPGELHLLEGLAATGAELAGEGNGGVVVPEMVRARDGLAAAVSILELLARTGEPLSALVSGLPRLARRRSTVPCADARSARALLAAVAEAAGAEEAQPETGVVVERDDGTWALARQSATEPVLRLTVEGPSADAVEAMHAELEALLVGARV